MYLVDQLREEPSAYECRRGLDVTSMHWWHDLCCKAADEIERLEKQAEEQGDKAEKRSIDSLGDAIQGADEHDRLTAQVRAGEATRFRLFEEIVQLREAGFDIVQRIEEWEVAVKMIIGHAPGHGMDLTQLRAALRFGEPTPEKDPPS
jgi:hypothetical protein